MLTIKVQASEFFNDKTQQFYKIKSRTLHFEHSLDSLSKWESMYETPFLIQTELSGKKLTSYIKVMCLDKNIPDEIFHNLSIEDINQITDYINAKMTATTFFNSQRPSPSRETITAEIIEYWMIELGVPYEYRYHHLNRLLALLNVINIKRNPNKRKMTQAEVLEQNRRIVEQRRREYGTSG